MSTNQFTGTAIQPQRNRNYCQFNHDQYCTVSKCLTVLCSSSEPLSSSFSVCPGSAQAPSVSSYFYVSSSSSSSPSFYVKTILRLDNYAASSHSVYIGLRSGSNNLYPITWPARQRGYYIPINRNMLLFIVRYTITVKY